MAPRPNGGAGKGGGGENNARFDAKFFKDIANAVADVLHQRGAGGSGNAPLRAGANPGVRQHGGANGGGARTTEVKGSKPNGGGTRGTSKDDWWRCFGCGYDENFPSRSKCRKCDVPRGPLAAPASLSPSAAAPNPTSPSPGSKRASTGWTQAGTAALKAKMSSTAPTTTGAGSRTQSSSSSGRQLAGENGGLALRPQRSPPPGNRGEGTGTTAPRPPVAADASVHPSRAPRACGADGAVPLLSCFSPPVKPPQQQDAEGFTTVERRATRWRKEDFPPLQGGAPPGPADHADPGETAMGHMHEAEKDDIDLVDISSTLDPEDEQPTLDQLRATYEEESKLLRVMEGSAPVASRALQLQRAVCEEAKAAWDAAKPMAPEHRRLQRANAALAKAQKALDTTHEEVRELLADFKERREALADQQSQQEEALAKAQANRAAVAAEIGDTDEREQLSTEVASLRNLVHAVGAAGPNLLAIQEAVSKGQAQWAVQTLQRTIDELGRSFEASRVALRVPAGSAPRSGELGEPGGPARCGNAPMAPASPTCPADSQVPLAPHPPGSRERPEDQGDEREPKRHEPEGDASMAAQMGPEEVQRQSDEALALHLRQKQGLAAGWGSPEAVGLAAAEFRKYVAQVYERASTAGVQCTLDELQALAPEDVDAFVAKNGLRL